MGRPTVIYLIHETREQDEYGVLQTTKTRRKIFAEVRSVTSSEFFEGGRSGLNPEFSFEIFFAEYKDERTLEYQGKLYGIYRKYWGGSDKIELYAERKGGVNG